VNMFSVRKPQVLGAVGVLTGIIHHRETGVRRDRTDPNPEIGRLPNNPRLLACSTAAKIFLANVLTRAG
jgi:hypothetical protein